MSSCVRKEKNPAAKIFGDALKGIVRSDRNSKNLSHFSSNKREKNKGVSSGNFENTAEELSVMLNKCTSTPIIVQPRLIDEENCLQSTKDSVLSGNDISVADSHLLPSDNISILQMHNFEYGAVQNYSSSNQCHSPESDSFAFERHPYFSERDQAMSSSKKRGSSKHTLLLSDVLPPVTQGASSKHALRLSEVLPPVTQERTSKHTLRLCDVLPTSSSPFLFDNKNNRKSPNENLIKECSVLKFHLAPSFLEEAANSDSFYSSPSNSESGVLRTNLSDSGIEDWNGLKSSSCYDSGKEYPYSEPSFSCSPYDNLECYQVVPSYFLSPANSLSVKSESSESLPAFQLTSDDDTDSGKSSPIDISFSEEKGNLPNEFEKKAETQPYQFENVKNDNRDSCSKYLPEYPLDRLLTFRSPGFIDSHCHLDLVLRRRNFIGSFAEFRKKFSSEFPVNYEGCIAIFCYPDTFHKKYLWSKQLDDFDVWTSFGCHPKRADFYNDKVESALKEALTHHKVRALGEIGLDYSKGNRCLVRVQQSVFKRQLLIALEKNLPLVIHCREAHEDCFNMMKLYVPKEYKIHMHCFKATWSWAQKWLNEFPNLCIGITNCVTYSGARTVHEVVRKIPLNRLLLETDAPYFVPNAIYEKNSWSHPGMAIHVAAQIAVLKEVPLRDVLHNTLQNTRTLYNL